MIRIAVVNDTCGRAGTVGTSVFRVVMSEREVVIECSVVGNFCDAACRKGRYGNRAGRRSISGRKYLPAQSQLCIPKIYLACACLSIASVPKHNIHHMARVSHGSVQCDFQLTTSAAQRNHEMTGASSTSSKVTGGGTDSRN